MKVGHIPGLERDIRGMQDWYPQFRLVVPLQGLSHWRGTLQPFRTRLDRFEVALVYPPTPTYLPKAWVIGPELSRRTHPFHPHLHADGSACTFFAPDRTYDPDRDDISRLLDLTGDWLRRHLFLEAAGWWPGREAPHEAVDVLASLEHKPHARCVCGRKAPFRLCCKQRYTQIAATASAISAPTRGDWAQRRVVQEIFRASRTAVGFSSFARAMPRLGPPAWLLAQCADVGSRGATTGSGSSSVHPMLARPPAAPRSAPESSDPGYCSYWRDPRAVQSAFAWT
jgi:hypothetical protein